MNASVSSVAAHTSHRFIETEEDLVLIGLFSEAKPPARRKG